MVIAQYSHICLETCRPSSPKLKNVVLKKDYIALIMAGIAWRWETHRYERSRKKGHCQKCNWAHGSIVLLSNAVICLYQSVGTLLPMHSKRGQEHTTTISLLNLEWFDIDRSLKLLSIWIWKFRYSSARSRYSLPSNILPSSDCKLSLCMYRCCLRRLSKFWIVTSNTSEMWIVCREISCIDSKSGPAVGRLYFIES